MTNEYDEQRANEPFHCNPETARKMSQWMDESAADPDNSALVVRRWYCADLSSPGRPDSISRGPDKPHWSMSGGLPLKPEAVVVVVMTPVKVPGSPEGSLCVRVQAKYQYGAVVPKANSRRRIDHLIGQIAKQHNVPADTVAWDIHNFDGRSGELHLFLTESTPFLAWRAEHKTLAPV